MDTQYNLISNTIAEQANRNQLLNEAAALAKTWESLLSVDGEGNTRYLKKTSDLSEKLLLLKNEAATFHQNVSVIKVNANELQESGFIADSGNWKKLLKVYDFYVVTITVALLPVNNWQFDRLQCNIILSSDPPESTQPVAHDLLPNDGWESLMLMTSTFQIGLDENLHFSTQVDMHKNERTKPDRTLKSSMYSLFDAKDYSLSQSRIHSTGINKSMLRWRLSEANLMGKSKIQFGIVVNVPSGLGSIRAKGSLEASRSVKFWRLTLGELLDGMPKRIHSFFLAGAPVSDVRSWDIL
jgi:hypothetical protein